MRLIFLAFLLCAATPAADSRGTAEPVAMSSGQNPKVSKRKRIFHPLRLLRLLGKAESEFGLRLSSLGIQPEVDAGKSEAYVEVV
jgi:hypothetical protein